MKQKQNSKGDKEDRTDKSVGIPKTYMSQDLSKEIMKKLKNNDRILKENEEILNKMKQNVNDLKYRHNPDLRKNIEVVETCRNCGIILTSKLFGFFRINNGYKFFEKNGFASFYLCYNCRNKHLEELKLEIDLKSAIKRFEILESKGLVDRKDKKKVLKFLRDNI